MDGPIDMKKGYESCDFTHDLDLWFSKLNFDNNYIWERPLDISSVHVKHFYHSFDTLGSDKYFRGDVRNIGVSVVGIVIELSIL